MSVGIRFGMHPKNSPAVIYQFRILIVKTFSLCVQCSLLLVVIFVVYQGIQIKHRLVTFQIAYSVHTIWLLGFQYCPWDSLTYSKNT